MTTLNIRKVDPELIKEARIAAIKQGKTLKWFVEQAMREKLERSK